jgi:hypothetical protein
MDKRHELGPRDAVTAIQTGKDLRNFGLRNRPLSLQPQEPLFAPQRAALRIANSVHLEARNQAIMTTSKDRSERSIRRPLLTVAPVEPVRSRHIRPRLELPPERERSR